MLLVDQMTFREWIECISLEWNFKRLLGRWMLLMVTNLTVLRVIPNVKHFIPKTKKKKRLNSAIKCFFFFLQNCIQKMSAKNNWIAILPQKMKKKKKKRRQIVVNYLVATLYVQHYMKTIAKFKWIWRWSPRTS